MVFFALKVELCLQVETFHKTYFVQFDFEN